MRRPTAVALTVVALLGAGCSSPRTPTDVPDSAAPTSPVAPASHGSLAECLAAHGVSDSGGPAVVLGPPAGVDQATWEQAMKACSALAPGPAAP